MVRGFAVTLSSFLNISGAVAGLLSALFFAHGTLHLKNKDIADIAGTYWDFNQHLADSIASQRAEYIVGALLLFLSFSLQVVANLIPSTLQPSLIQPFDSAGLGICVVLFFLAVAAYSLCSRIATQSKVAVRQVLEERTKASNS